MTVKHEMDRLAGAEENASDRAEQTDRAVSDQEETGTVAGGSDTERTEAAAADIVQVGTLRGRRGSMVHGTLEIGRDGEFRIPGSLICGAEDGPAVLITAGIHGGEYVGIRAAIRLSLTLDPAKIRGSVLILKAVSRRNFEHRYGSVEREDSKNLNRVFPGAPYGTVTERLAWALKEEIFPRADYYIDLHGGDEYEELVPYVYYPGSCAEDVSRISRDMACQTDVSYMVRSGVSSGGAYNEAASMGIPSVLLERGGMGRWTESEAEADRRDVCRILSSLGVLTESAPPRTVYPQEIRQVTYQFAEGRGLWYPAKRAGDRVSRGEYLGSVRDYEGRVKEVSTADVGGVILSQTMSLQVVSGGSMIAYGQIEYELDPRKERIRAYWQRRSESFLEQRRRELQSPLAGRWLEELLRPLPCAKGEPGKRLEGKRVLDVGCGAGFFSILLAREGAQVTGIDLTDEMVENARTLASEAGAPCEFFRMDAENPDFPPESFDLIVMRNVTWTLPGAADAYKAWLSLLKKGAYLLNFDADYGAEDSTDLSELPEKHAHFRVGMDMMRENEAIKRQLPINSFHRPAWDLDVVARLGIREIFTDMGVSGRVYLEKDDFYNPTPMFLLAVHKPA